MGASSDSEFIDLSKETSELGIEVSVELRHLQEGADHLGGTVSTTGEGRVKTDTNYKKLKARWSARCESRREKMNAMPDQVLLSYVSTMMVGVALFYGCLSSNRVKTLKFIRDFHSRLAWSYLLSRYSSKEITRNEKLYYRETLRLPTYKELLERVERLSVSTQLGDSFTKCKHVLTSLINEVRKWPTCELLGLLTLSKSRVRYCFLLYCTLLM